MPRARKSPGCAPPRRGGRLVGGLSGSGRRQRSRASAATGCPSAARKMGWYSSVRRSSASASLRSRTDSRSLKSRERGLRRSRPLAALMALPTWFPPPGASHGGNRSGGRPRRNPFGTMKTSDERCHDFQNEPWLASRRWERRVRRAGGPRPPRPPKRRKSWSPAPATRRAASSGSSSAATTEDLDGPRSRRGARPRPPTRAA